jgi:5-formyltetrahydrofolate cyclo-ligase
MDEKSTLRKKLLAQRGAMNTAWRTALSQKICARLGAWARENGFHHPATPILGYAPTGSEPDIFPFLEAALCAGQAVALPKCGPAAGEMCFYYVDDLRQLHPGAFGIREPAAARPVPARELAAALCLVPGLAFDEVGHRLGYGKGYYDRFLRDEPAKSLGICFSLLLQPRLPAAAHDRCVSVVLTEEGAADTTGRNQTS